MNLSHHDAPYVVYERTDLLWNPTALNIIQTRR